MRQCLIGFFVAALISGCSSQQLTKLPDRTHLEQEGFVCKGASAIQFIVDKSASARGPLIENEKFILQNIIKALPSIHSVGIIAFDSTPFIIGKRGVLTEEHRARLHDRIDRLFPSQKSNILPALELARRDLIGAEEPCKHVVIFTDGRLPDAETFCADYAAQLRSMGIVVSLAIYSETEINSAMEQFRKQLTGFYLLTNDTSYFSQHAVALTVGMTSAY